MNDIDSILRKDAAVRLADDGFTRRVLGALPPVRRVPAWLRPALVMGSSVAGSAIAVMLAPRDGSYALSVADFLSSGVISQAMLTSLAVGAVLVASAVVLALDAE